MKAAQTISSGGFGFVLFSGHFAMNTLKLLHNSHQLLHRWLSYWTGHASYCTLEASTRCQKVR